MRFRFPLMLAALLSPSAVLAGPSPEEVRALALAGDMAGVEAAFDTLRAASDAGEATGQDLRTLVEALAGSDPALAAFADRWIAAEPASPHARTVRAWQLVDEGWRLRGGQSMTWISQDAFDGWQDRHGQAADSGRKGLVARPPLPARLRHAGRAGRLVPGRGGQPARRHHAALGRRLDAPRRRRLGPPAMGRRRHGRGRGALRDLCAPGPRCPRLRRADLRRRHRLDPSLLRRVPRPARLAR